MEGFILPKCLFQVSAPGWIPQPLYTLISSYQILSSKDCFLWNPFMGTRDTNTWWQGREPSERWKEGPRDPELAPSLWPRTLLPAFSEAPLASQPWSWASSTHWEKQEHVGKLYSLRDPHMGWSFCFLKSELNEWTKLQKGSHVSRYRALNCLN